MIFLDYADGNLTKVLACVEWPHPRWFPGFGWKPVSGYFTTLGEGRGVIPGAPGQHYIYWKALPSHAIFSETNEISSFWRNRESSPLVRISRSLRSGLKGRLHQMCSLSLMLSTASGPLPTVTRSPTAKNTPGLQVRTCKMNAIPIKMRLDCFSGTWLSNIYIGSWLIKTSLILRHVRRPIIKKKCGIGLEKTNPAMEEKLISDKDK